MNSHDVLCRLTPPMPDPAQDRSSPVFQFTLTGVFRRDCIEIVERDTGKSAVIGRLVQNLARAGLIDGADVEKITSEILDREQLSSSALGKGFAFPHLRTPHVSQFAGAIGVAPCGIEFGSCDQQPTTLVFLTLSPCNEREQHTDLLSRLVSLMRDKTVNLQMLSHLQPETICHYLRDLDGLTGSPVAGNDRTAGL